MCCIWCHVILYTVFNLNYMVRTQLYLPEEKYEYVKKIAEKKNISFASYVRILIDKDEEVNNKPKSLKKRFPFLKYAGTFNLGGNASGEVDSIYDLI